MNATTTVLSIEHYKMDDRMDNGINNDIKIKEQNNKQRHYLLHYHAAKFSSTKGISA